MHICKVIKPKFYDCWMFFLWMDMNMKYLKYHKFYLCLFYAYRWIDYRETGNLTVKLTLFSVRLAALFLQKIKIKIVLFCKLSIVLHLVNSKSIYFHSLYTNIQRVCSLDDIKLDNQQIDIYPLFIVCTRKWLMMRVIIFTSIAARIYRRCYAKTA